MEAGEDTKHRTIERIASAGRLPGLAVSPDTPIEAITSYAAELGIVMIMTVVPGFGGQHFMAEPAAKIAAARRLLGSRIGTEVHVDGGVSSATAAVVGGYGVDVCVVGSALFQRGRDAALEVQAVKRAAAAPSGD